MKANYGPCQRSLWSLERAGAGSLSESDAAFRRHGSPLQQGNYARDVGRSPRANVIEFLLAESVIA